MEVKVHDHNTLKIAELISNIILIENEDSGFQLMIDLYYKEFDAIIINLKNISPLFLILKQD
jgi:hypothetical protein